MSQYTHVVMHHPNDIILAMSQGGAVTAFEVQQDGHLEPMDVATALSLVTKEQKAQADKDRALFT